MKKVISSILIICIGLLIITGCEKKDKGSIEKMKEQLEQQNGGTSSSKIQSTDDLNNKSGLLTCTREATAEGDLKPYFSYVVTYKDAYLLRIHSIEKVSSESGTGLDAYYDAYVNINKKYEGLDGYNSQVNKTNTSVTRDTIIDYENIDTAKLLEIEGSENNIINSKGKASLNKWLTLATKFGTKCSEGGTM